VEEDLLLDRLMRRAIHGRPDRSLASAEPIRQRQPQPPNAGQRHIIAVGDDRVPGRP
jgi:hypothetical protein